MLKQSRTVEKASTKFRLSKNPTMYFIIVTAVAILLWMLISEFGILLGCLAMLPCIWSCYYLLATVYSIIFLQHYKPTSLFSCEMSQNIALLMTVCDDFNTEAAQTLVLQDYPNYHVFILDDSTSKAGKEKVSNWCRENENICTLIRRGSQVGYKAGNLNYAEQKIPLQYQVFCVVDSDQHLFPSYLHQIINKYDELGKPAFVQGIHLGMERGVSRFSRLLAPTIFAEWKYHIAYKNHYGLTGTAGHGYLINRNALSDVGGYPEIVSEDLALSVNLSTSKQYGVMLPAILSSEIYPESLRAIQQRRYRWIIADWELIFSRHFAKFCQNTATFSEKIDLVLREFRLPISSIYFLIIFTLMGLDLLAGNKLQSLSISSSVAIPLFLLSLSPFYSLFDVSQHSMMKNLRSFFAVFGLALSFPSLQMAGGIYFIKGKKASFWVTNESEPNSNKRDSRMKLLRISDLGICLMYFVTLFSGPNPAAIVFGIALLYRLLFAHFFITRNEHFIVYVGGLIFILLIISMTFTNINILWLLMLISMPFILV